MHKFSKKLENGTILLILSVLSGAALILVGMIHILTFFI